MAKVIYIDPQSYNNLSLYDCGVFSEFNSEEVVFIGSNLWNCKPLSKLKSKLWFKYNNIRNPLFKFMSYFFTLIKIARLVKKEIPAIVHIQWLRVPTVDYIFAKYLKREGVKIVFTAHNILPHDSGLKYKEQYRRYYNLIDKIIVHSQTTKEELSEMFSLNPSQIAVIPHGIIEIEVESGKNVDTRIEELRHELNLGHKIVFSSLGAQNRYKGVDVIVDVWRSNERLANNPECHLIIAGKNSDIDFSSLKGIDNVTIIDERLSNCDFLSFIKLSDVILLPYRKISQSGVLFSALSNDIPVIVSSTGGLTDPFKYGNIGWCIGETTTQNLAECILNLVNNRDKIIKLKLDTETFDKVKSAYSWSNISLATKKLYRSLIN